MPSSVQYLSVVTVDSLPNSLHLNLISLLPCFPAPVGNSQTFKCQVFELLAERAFHLTVGSALPITTCSSFYGQVNDIHGKLLEN